VLILFMALLSFRGISTPSLPAQGEQRRFSYFNTQRGNPQVPVRTIPRTWRFQAVTRWREKPGKQA
jgi:hypothetical protein